MRSDNANMVLGWKLPHCSFCMIQLHAPCEAALGKQSELGCDELVKLPSAYQSGSNEALGDMKVPL